jgi:hypothetical protein
MLLISDWPARGHRTERLLKNDEVRDDDTIETKPAAVIAYR